MRYEFKIGEDIGMVCQYLHQKCSVGQFDKLSLKIPPDMGFFTKRKPVSGAQNGILRYEFKIGKDIGMVCATVKNAEKQFTL